MLATLMIFWTPKFTLRGPGHGGPQ